MADSINHGTVLRTMCLSLELERVLVLTNIEVRLSDCAYRRERLELSRELQEHAESS